LVCLFLVCFLVVVERLFETYLINYQRCQSLYTTMIKAEVC